MADNKKTTKAIPTKKYKIACKEYKTQNKSYKKGDSIELTEKGARMLKNQNVI